MAASTPLPTLTQQHVIIVLLTVETKSFRGPPKSIYSLMWPRNVLAPRPFTSLANDIPAAIHVPRWRFGPLKATRGPAYKSNDDPRTFMNRECPGLIQRSNFIARAVDTFAMVED